MASTPLFSSYRTGENRVTGSMLAVFERVGLDVLERLLGPASGEDDLALVRFRNQITDTAGSVPDASISAGFRLLLEVKTVPDAPDSGLGDQVKRHLAGLDGSYGHERLYVITPDVQAPAPLEAFDPPQVTWVNFAGLDAAIAAVLEDQDQPVSEQSAFLLRELRRLFDVEGLLDQQDTVIVAAKRAYPAYERTAAYVCQPGRSFRRGLTYLGFYAHGEIKPIVTRIKVRSDDVLFTSENAERLRERGETALADVIDETMGFDSERDGQKWQVLLLSEPGAPETIDLPSAIRNTTVVNGRPWAWTLGQRYARSDLLQRGFETTTDLDTAGGNEPMMKPAAADDLNPGPDGRLKGTPTKQMVAMMAGVSEPFVLQPSADFHLNLLRTTFPPRDKKECLRQIGRLTERGLLPEAERAKIEAGIDDALADAWAAMEQAGYSREDLK